MGLLDIFGGGTPAAKAQRLRGKVMQKWGDPTSRQKAITTLGEMRTSEAVAVLMQRFTFAVEPQTTDRSEKETVFHYICEMGADAVPAVKDFLARSDVASSWALKILDTVLPEPEVLGIVCDELNRLGAEYTRDPEKKEVLLHHLEGKGDERVGPALLPFIHDMSDDVRMGAVRTAASIKYEPAREPILQLLVGDETAKRVQTACLNALAETGFGVQGFREKVEARLGDGYQIDRSGVVKKRA